jgi:hypothetical protein
VTVAHLVLRLTLQASTIVVPRHHHNQTTNPPRTLHTMSSHLSDAPASSTKSPPSPRSKNQSNPSITEPSSFPKLHRSHHHHHHIHRHHAKDTHSAHSNPRSSASLIGAEMDASKSEGVTPIHSQNPSRRASFLGTSPELEGMLLSWKAERKNVKEIQVREEKERGILRSSFVIPTHHLSLSNLS